MDLQSVATDVAYALEQCRKARQYLATGPRNIASVRMGDDAIQRAIDGLERADEALRNPDDLCDLAGRDECPNGPDA